MMLAELTRALERLPADAPTKSYAAAIVVAWIVLFVLWFALGIPLGPGYPVST